MLITAMYHQPASEGVEECFFFKVADGPKDYLRLWPRGQGIDWGWHHGDARCIWSSDSGSQVEFTVKRNV